MIQVGFALEFDTSWLGGISYYRNLLRAVHALPDRKIDPVVFIGRKASSNLLTELPSVVVVRSALLDRHSLPWWIRRVLNKILFRDLLLESLLRRHGINVLSHSGSLGKGSRIPCLCWLPDLQHKRMPQFFEAWEIGLRDSIIRSWCCDCRGIILSSNDSKRDLLEFYPDCQSRLAVLPFVSEVGAGVSEESGIDLSKVYGIEGRFFFVANQFWAHKNHQVLIEALQSLKAQGKSVQIVATGNTSDYRQSGFYEKLTAAAADGNVTDEFRVLGVVPYGHLSVLMQQAVAVINPSLFEGWNTAVEEAKSLGKQIILSDIPVHREQAPARADYFSPGDAAALAQILWQRWEQYDREADLAEMKKAVLEFPQRQREFGLRFQDTVLGMLEKTGTGRCKG